QKKVMFLDSGLIAVIPKEEEKELDEECDGFLILGSLILDP
nr:hypothetical protein [Tanacetum cinerariifolium]